MLSMFKTEQNNMVIKIILYKTMKHKLLETRAWRASISTSINRYTNRNLKQDKGLNLTTDFG